MSSHSHGRGKQEGEFEVTGVSRSGRVRKKSSKLMDFESPEEIERQSRKQHAAENRTPATSKKVTQHVQQEIKRPIFPDLDTGRLTQVKEAHYSETDSEPGMYPAPGDEDPGSSLDSLDSEDDDDMEGGMMIDERGSNDTNTQPQGASLYMLERSKKKKLVVQDGKVVGRAKAERKDKGKSRFTAYMTWAKEVRGDLMKKHPELDFSQTSRKLSDLWKTVPQNEKYVWKKRAKRLADDMLIKEKTKKMIGSNSRKFINKQSNVVAVSSPVTTPKGQQVVHLGQPSVIGKIPVSPPDISRHSRMKGGEGLVQEPVLGTGLYKVVGTQPIDLAAHLRLLGESLNIIGERLKEHEGQIAVSGSYSVLLDSLICALGPLMCLMQQVGETNIIPNDRYAQVLDNIAYIMPGL
ncbi:uncharacterized protein [Bemisia tabaci]|uniref:uncharacterized protein n=1 Tax=Bemisia tabaci TaxID=7038 RepID=UPI0008F9B038|nr:PREDICTED: HMG box-containing protein 4 [Bemisia tabaci]